MSTSPCPAIRNPLAVAAVPLAVKKPFVVPADYLWELHSAFERHGIEIPFPQQDLHVR